MTAVPVIPAEVEELAARTFFGELPAELRTRMLAPGMLIDTPAGTVIYRPGEAAHLVLLLGGVARMYREDASGRRMAIRYVGRGDVMGLVAVVGGPANLTTEVLADGRGWMIPGESLRALARQEPRLAWIMAEECARRVYHAVDELASAAFESVRIRLIRHLLKFARDPAEPAVVRVTQQELADSIATSREVVARSMREFRERGWVSTQPDSPGMIRIEQPQALRAELPEAFSAQIEL